MGHPKPSLLADEHLSQPPSEIAPGTIVERYVAHLEQTLADLRETSRNLMEEVRELREDAWRRGLKCAEYRARADTEREHNRILFEMLVEAEGRRDPSR